MKAFWLRWLVLSLYGASAFASPVPTVVGLVGLTGPQSGDMRRASIILQSRFHRWIEDQGGEITLRRLAGSLDPALLNRERLRQDLVNALSEWRSSFPAGRGKGAGRVTILRKALETDLAAGPTVAGSLGWESVGAWLRGEYIESEALWNNAVGLSPEGELSGVPFAEAAPAGWQKMADRVVSSLKRDCLLSFPGLGRGESVNGFAVTPTRGIAVASGRAFLVGWRDESEGYHASTIACVRPGQRMVGGGSLVPVDLAGFVGAQLVDALILMEAKEEHFRFYLFTREGGLDEIALDGDMTAAEILAKPLANDLPIDAAAFRRLRESHRLGASGIRVAGPWLGSERSEVSLQAAAPRWYNKWTTWAVAGGILTGVLVAYLASRPGQVRTQAHGGLSFRVE